MIEQKYDNTENFYFIHKLYNSFIVLETPQLIKNMVTKHDF